VCGIDVQFDIKRKNDFKTNNFMIHRGPDYQDTIMELNGSLRLTHWRLSIIDLHDRSNQPYQSSDRRYSLVFNGEIYNYLELRKNFISEGLVFHTNSDTEVLMVFIERYGFSKLNLLEGMFSFAVWDSKRETLTIVRDRFGIKPLYWRLDDKKLEIGSEIKQVLPANPKFNLPRVLDYLESGLTDFSDETLFDSVFQVEPGCLIEYKIEESVKFRKTKWAKDINSQSPLNDFQVIFEESIEKHFRSDVEVGSCLSGGLDSAAIVAASSSRSKEKMFKTFTAVFPGTSVDESRKAKSISEFCSTDHYEVQVNPFDALEQIEKLTWHHDEPTGSTSMYAQWRVFEEAKEHGVKVMLDGQGADEILGGYHSTFPYMEIEQKSQFTNTGKIKLDAFSRIQKIKKRQQTSKVAKLLHFSESWLASDLFELDPSRINAWSNALEAKGFKEPRSVKDFCNVMTYAVSLPMLLHSEDRNSMAHGIEARVPFLYQKLVDYSLKLDTSLRMNSTFTKLPVRDYLVGRVPSEIYLEPKKLGFATPEQEWFQGVLSEKVEELFMGTINEFPEFFNRSNSIKMFQERMSGSSNWDFNIWRVLSFAAWVRLFRVS
jgi:asparagine synthase (glutamine-hydrolysing)